MYLKAARSFMETAEKRQADSDLHNVAAGLMSLTEAIEIDLQEIKARLAVLELGQQQLGRPK
jgi:hypothetical protein